jgi:hypothetical protein
MYRNWFKIALELERKFGPQERTWSVIEPNKGYAFRHFQNAQLQGQITIAVEDGSNMPKTSLGKRAAIEQANQLRLIDPADPDQRYALLTNFGLSDLAPSLDIHVQAALQLQDSFEKWAETKQGPPPLVVKPWFDFQIHYNERIKWLNGDKMREMMDQDPSLEMLIEAHLSELRNIIAPPMMAAPGAAPGAGSPSGAPGGPPPPQGGAMAMANSNQNSGSTSSVPSGQSIGNQGQGPV